MEQLVELSIKKIRSNEFSSTIFQLLGKFGDRLPQDVQDEMREMAETNDKKVKNIDKKMLHFLK